MSTLSRFWTQSFFLAPPRLTELSDQHGRVTIVTGGYAGVGYELSKILYQHNGTVYVAGRSPEKGERAINAIKAAIPRSKGRLEFLFLDLGNLTGIKKSAEEFMIPLGSKTIQGYELQIGTNCVAPYLFTKLLTPLLQQTAASSPAGSVRVTWAASLGVDVQSPPHGGFDLASDGAPILNTTRTMTNYGMSKVGNYFLASQFAVRNPVKDGKGVLSLAFNPGNLRTELQRDMQGLTKWVISTLLLYPAVFGGYTELYAGWAEETGRAEHHGGYVLPWGRVGDVRDDVQHEIEAGKKGEGKAVKFWEWCDSETKAYL
ncbi:short-chain alcohol dehydrogenase [Elasticomyces elasticus]|nr:short-chain alcohol dehydrogenase [Elasticomyces elasticus]KAK3667672.1 short-chain alcohol dehydrogenase [Elasticomyces elasticus]KAK4920833.1 short-chain alcohol dehydrogenase [Elasticomyces elasticus]KAK5767174.1 short-chain alcohol dehydrogenase [Elasticomyces elasticus]